MSPYNQEQLDIIRRIAERGRRMAFDYNKAIPDFASRDFVDVFQHILDELERINLE